MSGRQPNQIARLCGPQRSASCVQGCPGRDHIVHHGDTPASEPPGRQESGSSMAFEQGPSCLRRAVTAAEKRSARQAQLACNPSGQEFGVVEPTTTATEIRGRGPRDEFNLTRSQQTGDPPAQPTNRRTHVAILELSHDLTGRSLVREQSRAPIKRRRDRDRARGHHSGNANGAGGRASPTAAGTGGGEQHAPILRRGSDTQNGWVPGRGWV